MKKNAQIEIAGLIIIVVLVSLVLLFTLSININKVKNVGSEQKTIRHTQLRERFGPVLLETTTDCSNKNVRELLIDCAFINQIQCGALDSCAKANQVMSTITEKTFDDFYVFKLEVLKNDAQLNGINVIENTNPPRCGDEKYTETQPAYTNIGSVYGNLVLVLTQCY